MSAASEKQKTKKQKNKTATNIVPFTFPAAPYCHAVFFSSCSVIATLRIVWELPIQYYMLGSHISHKYRICMKLTLCYRKWRRTKQNGGRTYEIKCVCEKNYGIIMLIGSCLALSLHANRRAAGHFYDQIP